MKKAAVIFLAFFIVAIPVTLKAQDEIDPWYTLSLGAKGGYIMPLGEHAESLEGGINASIFMNYNPRFFNNFLIQPEFMFSSFQGKTNKDISSNFFSLGLNASYSVPILNWLEINATAGGGYYFNSVMKKNVEEGSASNPYVKGFLGVDFIISSHFDMSVGASYLNYLSATDPMSTLIIMATGNYRFGQSPEEMGYDWSLEINEISINPLFSAMYKYYETEPAGKLKISNVSNKDLKNVKAAVHVKDYMDYPTPSKVVDVLKAGESVDIDLHMLFNMKVLSVTEDTPLTANVSINYLVAERDYTKEESTTFKLYNRNAMTWSDDRKLAAFITPKDPPGKVFARSVIQQYQDEKINVLNQNLQSAMEIFDALGVYGLAYIPDPKTPFTKFSEQKDAVDYIQYPRETLRFKTGDCDDMVALYSSLLENIGISTALVTIPGHIFMMFDTGVSKYDYREITEDRGMLIEKGDNVWIPVEVTLAGETFMRAWQEGARQYNKTLVNNQDVGIFPTAEAWNEFVPVTLEDWGWEPDVPQKGQIAELYDKDVKLLVGSELNQKVKEIKDEIAQDPRNAKLYNKLGITYGRYGKYDDAIEALKKAIQLNTGYASAYNNLGNVHYLIGRYEEALSYYTKALNYNESPLILINIAKTVHKMGDYEKAQTYYLSAVKKDKRFEKKYAYLGMGSGTELRASDRAKIDVMVEWAYQ
ncbi:MAG: tetratricopeptide repeat protein [Spirochaetota bacterium]|nr:MAG: tetratricopeptide repeat protein [Spirochaetota bacterium]